jgi:hypothetical protein
MKTIHVPKPEPKREQVKFTVDEDYPSAQSSGCYKFYFNYSTGSYVLESNMGEIKGSYDRRRIDDMCEEEYEKFLEYRAQQVQDSFYY